MLCARCWIAQVRRNKQKHADKTAGRKWPEDCWHGRCRCTRCRSYACFSCCRRHRRCWSSNSSARQLLTSDRDVCHACDSAEPPVRMNRRQREINWVKCDDCLRWYHVTCVGVCNTNAAYKCDFCEWTYASCFHNVLFGLHFIFHAFNYRHSEVSRTFILLFFRF